MFTGIITEIGVVDHIERSGGGMRLSIRAPQSAAELHVNDSIAVSGVCQTVVAAGGEIFRVEAVEETLRKTTMGRLGPGSRVNLELALRLGDRLGGHLVSGHVDCVGVIQEVDPQASSTLIRIGYPEEFAKYLIPVGSIAVDGVSLTVARLEEGAFVVSIIPHTFGQTTLGSIRRGTRVNLEFDMVGKYIEGMVRGAPGEVRKGGITVEKLAQWGIDS